MTTAEEILGAVARGWCHPKNENKVMDPDLAIAIAAEVSATLAAREDVPSVTGECVEAGSDETGQPRIIIHTTREALRDGPPLPFRIVTVTPAAPPAQGTPQRERKWYDEGTPVDESTAINEAAQVTGEGCGHG